MNILEPTKAPMIGKRNKYATVYDAADKLVNGSAIPVQCDTDREARNLYSAIQTGRGRPRKYRANLRGNTVFVSLRAKE